MQESLDAWVLLVAREDPLQEGMATHSSILAWRILWTEEPGRLQFIGLQRVRHNWSEWTLTHAKQTRYSETSISVENLSSHWSFLYFLSFFKIWVTFLITGDNLGCMYVCVCVFCFLCASGESICKEQQARGVALTCKKYVLEQVNNWSSLSLSSFAKKGC